MKNLGLISLMVLLLAVVSGCSSGRVMITGAPQENYQKLGHAQGSACGALGLLGTAYYFIPIGLNSRYESAYNQAVASVPGAGGLIDVTLSEDWYWVLFATLRCVKVAGEAIK